MCKKKKCFRFWLGALAIFNSIPTDAFASGAITPFTVLEAEAGTLAGTDRRPGQP